MQEMPRFENAKVLVIGDVMLDSYWKGPVSRISPEAPVPVLNIADRERRLGGAANVALNIESLGATVYLLGMIGMDDEGLAFEDLLNHSKIKSHIVKVDDVPTITKLRIISQNQQLIRLDVENSFEASSKKELLARYDALLQKVDVVVISDYAKGTLSEVQTLIQMAKVKGKRVLVDPKGRDFEKYSGATLLTPNLGEFELVVGQCENEDIFKTKAQDFLNKLSLEALLVTRGAKGMTLFHHDHHPFQLTAHAKEVFDVTGAGDTVIGVLSALLALDMPLNEAVSIANYAAGIVVGHLGASRVTPHDLEAMMSHKESMTYALLKQRLNKHKANKEAFKLLFCLEDRLSLYQLQAWQALKEKGVYLYWVLPASLNPAQLKAIKAINASGFFVNELVVVEEEVYQQLQPEIKEDLDIVT